MNVKRGIKELITRKVSSVNKRGGIVDAGRMSKRNAIHSKCKDHDVDISHPVPQTLESLEVKTEVRPPAAGLPACR